MSTNQTPFARAVNSFLSHTIQTESKYMDVVEAMFEMETSFPMEWTKNFLLTNGEEKTSLIETTFRKLELEGYEDLLFKASKENKLEKGDDAARVEKETAQKKVHALHMMLKQVAYALCFLQLSKATKVKLINGRCKYLVDDGWEGGKKGESFNTLKAEGIKLANEQGWKAETKKQINHVSGQHTPSGPAGAAVSLTDTATKVVQSSGMIQPQAPNGASAFTQVCQALRTMLKTKPAEKMTESEQTELRHTERALIKYVFGDKSGKVDLEAIMAAYEDVALRQITQSPEDRKQVA